MKEFIYLDTKLINSYLAQMDEGLLAKATIGKNEQKTNGEEGGQQITKSGNVSGGVPGIVKAGTDYSQTEIDKFNFVFSESNTELVDTIMDDYSLDVLINKLTENKSLVMADQWKEGDFICIEDNFKIYDFEMLEELTKKESVNLVMIETEELKREKQRLENLSKKKQKSKTEKQKIEELKEKIDEQDSTKNFELVRRFASFSQLLYPNSILIIIKNTMSILDKNNLRVNAPIIAALGQTRRKLKMLGIVISKRDNNILPKDGEQLETSVIASSTPAMFTEIILDSYSLLEDDGYFIRPLAIYFESE